MNLRDGLREADAEFQKYFLSPRGARVAPRVGWKLAAVGLLAAGIMVALFPRWVEQHPRGVEVIASAGAQVQRDGDRIKVVSGEVTFVVAKRIAGEAPVRIEVSHGVIEVVGTRFTVRQRSNGGEVKLYEGIIRFGAVELHAGERLEWPERAKTTEAVEPPPTEVIAVPVEKPKPSRPHRTQKEPAVIHETDAEWLLDEVDLSRSRGEYPEAVRLLDKGLAGLVSKTTRERFSFELGSILTWQQDDSSRACRHWAKHRADFPKGRYAREVQSAEEHARCAR